MEWKVFERFVTEFEVIPRVGNGWFTWRDPQLLGVNGYVELAERFSGCSFESGLYRLHNSDSGPHALTLISDAFPEFSTRVRPFGYDWLGRQFAIDFERREGNEPLVLMLEPGTGEALEKSASFIAFHDEELVEYRDAALASDFFTRWCQTQPSRLPLGTSNCVGYRVPLFLGGSDTVDSLEVTDLGVYWAICGQLRLGTMHLPKGTTITDVSSRG